MNLNKNGAYSTDPLSKKKNLVDAGKPYVCTLIKKNVHLRKVRAVRTYVSWVTIVYLKQLGDKSARA